MLKNLILELSRWFYSESNIYIMTIDELMNMDEYVHYEIYCYTPNVITAKKSIDRLYDKLSKSKNLSIIEKTLNLLVINIDKCIIYIDLKNICDFAIKKHGYVFDKISITESNNIALENNDILPIPTHLKEILMPINKDVLNVSGNLKCLCGCDCFKLKYTEKDRCYIKCICDSCNNEYLIFDSHRHGWDGYVCKSFSQIIERARLKDFHCEGCNSCIFNVNVTISSQGKADFCRELKNEIAKGLFSENEWVEAFDWITISLICAKCKKNFPNFVDYETM